MNHSQSEKIRLEHEAAKLFMHRYEKDTGVHFRHIWHNEPSQPDVSAWLDGERLDIEIAHLYGSEQEAMKILGKDLSPKTQRELRYLESEQRVNITIRGGFGWLFVTLTLPGLKLISKPCNIALRFQKCIHLSRSGWWVIGKAKPVTCSFSHSLSQFPPGF